MNNIHIEFGSDIDTNANSNYIDNLANTSWLDNCYFFRSARDSLKFIAKRHKKNSKRIFMPIMCCDSMFMPFLKSNYEIIFYPLTENFTINNKFITDRIKNNDIILVENYLSLKSKKNIMIENKFLNKINRLYNVIIIQDYTQSLEEAIFSNKSLFDYTIFSVRKWASIPDGGIIWSRDHLDINYDNYDSSYFNLKKEAMDLKSMYLENHDITIKNKFLSLFKNAENLIETDDNIINISNYSKSLIKNINFQKILKTRKQHIKHFETNANFIRNLSNNTSCNGLYFPIYVDNQEKLQKYLAKNNIYCPIIWPMYKIFKDKEFKFCNDIINHMLAVPCDQRYSLEELDYIINTLRGFLYL